MLTKLLITIALLISADAKPPQGGEKNGNNGQGTGGQTTEGGQTAGGCAVGKGLLGKSLRCVNCPIGKYQDQTGATQCKPCEPNTYNGEMGASSCTTCEDRWTTSMAGATACTVKLNSCSYRCNKGTPKVGVVSCQKETKFCTKCDNDAYELVGTPPQCVQKPLYTCAGNVQKTTCTKCDCGFKLNNQGTGPNCIRDTTRAAGTGPNCETPVNCGCPNGVGASDGCTSRNPTKCKSCNVDEGFSLVQGFCIKPVCKCLNGSPSTGDDCPNSQNSCRTCVGTHVLIGTQCIRKQSCQCNGGGPGTDCNEITTEKCSKCVPGFTMDTTKNICVKDQTTKFNCKCPGGFPHRTCDKPPCCDAVDQIKCASCINTFQIDTTTETCTPKCTCDNGTPFADGCTSDTDTDKCKRCDVGFELSKSDESCTKKIVCTCLNGVEGTGCTRIGQQKCASCDGDLVRNPGNTACVDYQDCSCPNGTPFKQGCSGEMSTIKCQSCKSGFTNLDGTMCQSDCLCTNGQPDSNGCPDPKKLNSCMQGSCDDGHEMTASGTCEPTCAWTGHDANTCQEMNCNWSGKICSEKNLDCMCNNGVPAAANGQCNNVGSRFKCASCKEGFTPNGDKTRCNRDISCICKNGTPVSGACPAYSKYQCQLCDEGFEKSTNDPWFGSHVRSSYCNKIQQCECDNGTPETSCTGSFSNLRCKSCDGGFRLNENLQCEKIPTSKCQCVNGNGGPCSGREAKYRNSCESCDDGFKLTGTMCETKCSCDGGSPSAAGCASENKEKCQYCFAGNTITSTNTCEAEKQQCQCTMGTPSKDGCTNEAPEKCEIGSCRDGYLLNMRNGRCEMCMATKEYRPVCCNNKDYGNPSTAACDECHDSVPGRCNEKCTWAEHKSDSCESAPGCQWTLLDGATTASCVKAEFIKPPEVETMQNCIDTACDAFSVDYDKITFDTAIVTCGIDVGGEKRQQRECAVKKDKRLGDVFKTMMGYADTISENDKVEASKNRWSDARFAMAHSCYNCVMAATTTSDVATCETDAIAAFKIAFDDDFDNLPKKPSDVMIKALFKSSATEYTAKMRKDLCSTATMRFANKEAAIAFQRKCIYDTYAKYSAASGCRQLTTMDDTDKQEEKEEQTKAILGERCTKSAAECYADRKKQYKEETGKDDASDAEVRSKLKDIASEKASNVMGLCAKDIFTDTTNTAAVIKAARTKCLDLSKDEYIKYDNVDKTELDDTVMDAKLADVATKKAGDILKNGGNIDAAKKEHARLTGTKESEIGTNDMKSQLDQRAKVEASKMMRKCQTSRMANNICKSKYKAEYAARTGRSADDVDDTMIKEGEAKRKQEEAANALKTIAETKHKCKLAGAKSLAECKKEERDAKKQEMTRVSGKDVDDVDINRMERRAQEEEMHKIVLQCNKQKKSKTECESAMKDMVKTLTGKNVDDFEVAREKNNADDRIMAENAKILAEDTSQTDTQKKDARLAKLKELKGNPALSEEDLVLADKRMAKKLVEDDLEIVDDFDCGDNQRINGECLTLTSDQFDNQRKDRLADMKSKIEKMRPGETVTEKEVKDIRRKAENNNAGKELLAALRSGASRTEQKRKFEHSLKKQGAYSKTHKFDPIKLAKRRKEAKDALVQDIIDTDIDITDEVKRKSGRASQTKQTQERLKAAYGGEPKEWEARKEVERAAKNKLLNLRKQKMKTARGAGTTDTRNADAKLADNEALKLAYKKATGTKNVEVYQIKNKIKEAAVESDDMRAVMEAATTEADKKEALKNKMTELTGETPDDIELVKLVKRTCDTKLFETAKLRSQAFDKKKATMAQKKDEIIARRKAMKEDYEKTTGKIAKFHAQVKKSYHDAVNRESAKDYRECIKTGKSMNGCRSETAEKMSLLDEGDDKIDETEIAIRVNEGEKLAAVDNAKECKREKTADECRLETIKFIQESRGSSKTIPAYEAVRTLKEGSTKMLGAIMSECQKSINQQKCKTDALQDFKEKTLDDNVTEEDFEENIKEAAAKITYDMANNCDKKTEDCTQLLMETFKKSRGKVQVKKAKAVASVKAVLPDAVVEAAIACHGTKSKKECRDIVKKKIKAAKTWKQDDTEETSDAELEREHKQGAVQYAKRTFKACRNLAKDLTDKDAIAVERVVCKEAFDNDFKKAYPEAATSRPIMEKAQKDAQVKSVQQKMDAMADAMEDGATKTKEEIIQLIVAAVKDGAPVKDVTKLDEPMEQEKMLREAGVRMVRSVAHACRELGPKECIINKSGVDTSTTGEKSASETKISLAEEMFRGSGKTLMGKKPLPKDEQEVIRKAAKAEVLAGVRDCVDAGTDAKDMKKCLEDSEKTATVMHGNDKNTKKDRKAALNEDGIGEMDACMDAAGHTTWFCRSVMKERIKRTCGTVVSDDDVRTALLKKTASELDDKENTYDHTKPVDGETKDRGPDKIKEKDARDAVKKMLEKRGFEKRELNLALQKSAELRAIKKGADAIKAKAAQGVKILDADLDVVLEDALKEDPDAPDFTDEKKKSMKRNCQAIATGGVKGDLTFKKTGKLALCVCMTGERSGEEVTTEKIINLIKDSATASLTINTDTNKMIAVKEPKKDPISKRTCGTVHVEPRPGKTVKEAKIELDQIQKRVRRALRALVGRQLDDDEVTTSSGEVEIIVEGSEQDNTNTGQDDTNDDTSDTTAADAAAAKNAADAEKNAADKAQNDADKMNAGKSKQSSAAGAIAGVGVGALLVGLVIGALIIKVRGNKTEEHNQLQEEVEGKTCAFERRGSKNNMNPLTQSNEIIEMTSHSNPMRKKDGFERSASGSVQMSF